MAWQEEVRRLLATARSKDAVRGTPLPIPGRDGTFLEHTPDGRIIRWRPQMHTPRAADAYWKRLLEAAGLLACRRLDFDSE